MKTSLIRHRIQTVGTLLAQDGYDAESRTRIVADLTAEPEPHPALQALEQYYVTRARPLLEEQGISTTALIRRMDMEYPSAVGTVLWLKRAPEEALAALRYYSGGALGGCEPDPFAEMDPFLLLGADPEGGDAE